MTTKQKQAVHLVACDYIDGKRKNHKGVTVYDTTVDELLSTLKRFAAKTNKPRRRRTA